MAVPETYTLSVLELLLPWESFAISPNGAALEGNVWLSIGLNLGKQPDRLPEITLSANFDPTLRSKPVDIASESPELDRHRLRIGQVRSIVAEIAQARPNLLEIGRLRPRLGQLRSMFSNAPQRWPTSFDIDRGQPRSESVDIASALQSSRQRADPSSACRWRAFPASADCIS